MESQESELFYRRAENARATARQGAVSAAIKFELEDISIADAKIPLLFGPKWQKRMTRTKASLADTYGENLNSLFSFSRRYFVFACHDASLFIKELGHGSCSNNSLTTPDGYAKSEGFANTFYNAMAELVQPIELLQGTGFEKFPIDTDCINAIAVVWFYRAVQLEESGNRAEAMDYLFETSDALELANGLYMWGAAYECRSDELKAAGKRGAEIRHAPMGALRDWTITRYLEGKWPSANAAAFDLMESVVAHGVQIGAHLAPTNAQRTIAEWIRKSV